MITQEIIDAANKMNISEIGFVDAAEFSKKEISSQSEFIKKSSMTDVFSVMENAKSIGNSVIF